MAFVDRIVEYPGRVRLTLVEDDVYDMTREEGTVTEAGTMLSADNLNNEIAAAVADRLQELAFSSMSDMETQWESLPSYGIYAFVGTATWTNDTAPNVGSYRSFGLFVPVSATNADILFTSGGHLWYGRHAKGTATSSDFTRII